VVLDLYARVWDGQPLGPGDYVLCSDEKTSIQARCRCHPTLPAGKSRLMRVEHEYDRGGALGYLAAWDVHREPLFGRCEPTTIAPFGRPVEQVMTAEPDASAHRVSGTGWAALSAQPIIKTYRSSRPSGVAGRPAANSASVVDSPQSRGRS
jgi:hypothetical protein